MKVEGWEEKFAAEMLRLRTDEGISQNMLAKRLGERGSPFHQQQVDRIERGDRPVRLNEAMAIAAYFGKSLPQMLGAEDLTDASIDDHERALERFARAASRYFVQVQALRLDAGRTEDSIAATRAALSVMELPDEDRRNSALEAALAGVNFLKSVQRDLDLALSAIEKSRTRVAMKSKPMYAWLNATEANTGGLEALD